MHNPRDPLNKIVPIRQGVQPKAGKMTKLGDIFKQTIPSEPPPEELFWTCEACGPIEPLYVPVGKGRWIKRSCTCQKRERELREQAELLEAWKINQRQRTFNWLGKGWEEDPSLLAKTFETFDAKRQRKGYIMAVQFAHTHSGNFAFEGAFGTGKTHLAVAILHALREKGIASLFTSAPKLFAAYLDKLNHGEDHWAIIKQAISTPVLMIDDIDKPKYTETREELYFLIFDERVKAGKPIILSTNRMADLKDYIGEAALSRFMVGLQVAQMVGKDYREEM